MVNNNNKTSNSNSNNKGKGKGKKITLEEAKASVPDDDTFEKCGTSKNNTLAMAASKDLCRTVWEYHSQTAKETTNAMDLREEYKEYLKKTLPTSQPHWLNNSNASVTPKANTNPNASVTPNTSLAKKLKAFNPKNETNGEIDSNNYLYEGEKFEEYYSNNENENENKNLIGGPKAKKGGMMLVKQALIPAILTASAISYKKKKRKNQKGGLLALGANDAAVATLVAARMSLKNRKNKKGGKKTKRRKPKRKGTRKK